MAIRQLCVSGSQLSSCGWRGLLQALHNSAKRPTSPPLYWNATRRRTLFVLSGEQPVVSLSGCVCQWKRCLHCSPAIRGLEEFFPKTDDIIEEGEKTGRPWLARELRHKSSEDLHKLWYVLLKERNMLMTLKHEARRAGFITPAPERMWKVRKSMARIKVVIGERERAIRECKRILKEEEEVSEDHDNQQTIDTSRSDYSSTAESIDQKIAQ